MSQKQDLVRVFYTLDDFKSGKSIGSAIPREQARLLRTAGTHFFINHGRDLCYEAAHYTRCLAESKEPETAATGESPSSLTFGEMEANAGLRSEGFNRAARLKVRLWPFICDTYAPCVRPRLA